MPVNLLPEDPPDSRAEHLARSLREAIVRGDLPAGDRLVERDLSARTKVSRGPVREALRSLEREGLIVSVPYKGTYVAGISQQEVVEILIPIRLTLERFAVRHALPDMEGDDFAELEPLVADMARASREGDLVALVQDDLLFHEKLVARAGHHCLQVWHSIMPRVRTYFYRDGYRHVSLEELPREHAELLATMRTKDVDAVLELLERHILETTELPPPAPGDSGPPAGRSR